MNEILIAATPVHDGLVRERRRIAQPQTINRSGSAAGPVRGLRAIVLIAIYQIAMFSKSELQKRTMAPAGLKPCATSF